MYLPLASTVPLFLGGMISLLVQKRLQQKNITTTVMLQKKQIGTLIACGLVAGAALVDVVLTIPFSIWHSPDALKLVGNSWHNAGVFFAVVAVLSLATWIERRVCR